MRNIRLSLGLSYFIYTDMVTLSGIVPYYLYPAPSIEFRIKYRLESNRITHQKFQPKDLFIDDTICIVVLRRLM